MAEAQKDNTHIFENETATLLTEAYGEKIMKWANSGDGYTPPVRGREEQKEEKAAEDLSSIKKEIIAMCNQLGGTKNAELMTALKTYTANGNPNAIKDIGVAKECLEKIKGIKPVE